VEAAIASKPADRPSARWLVHWHPHLWPDRKRFAFLCAVANEEEVVKGKGKGAVVGAGKDLKKPAFLLPASLLASVLGKGASKSHSSIKRNGGDGTGESEGWVQRVDAAVWEQYTSDTRYRQVYDTSKLTHLLRFIRNSSQHPPAAWSPAKVAFAAEGGVGPYFLSRFPRLLMAVWKAVGAAGWGRRQEFSTFLPPPESAGIGIITTSNSSGRGGGSGSVQITRGQERVVERAAELVAEQQELQERQQQKEKEAAAEPASAVAAVAVAPPTGVSVSSIDTSSGASSGIDARSWTEEQVAAWLAGIGKASAYAQYGDAFETSGVNGELLLDGIEEEELIDLGVTSRLHRRRIMQDIAKLRIGARPS
jgi:hypothetical protein